MDGYVKEQFTNEHDETYPLDLNKVISQFLGNILLRFDICNSVYQKNIHDNGKKMKSEGSRVVAASSYGMDEGIHIIDIECIEPGEWDIIAIGSDIDECKQKTWISYMRGYKYWWYQGTGIFGEKDRKDIVPQFDVYQKWKAKDVIRMRVDCDEWRITFYKNNENVHEMPLYPNTKYHLIMITRGEFKIL